MGASEHTHSPTASLMESASDRKKRALEQLHATYGAPSAKVAKTNGAPEADGANALPTHVRNGCLKSALKVPGTPREMVANWLAKIVPGADPELVVASKLKDKVLALDNPQKSQFSIRAAERKLRKQRGVNDAMFGKRQMRQLSQRREGTDAECTKFEAFDALHQSWKRYVRECLGVHCKDGVLQSADQAMKIALHRMDFTGALVKVVQTRSPGMLGVEGVVVTETKHTLKLVTRADEFKVLPKAAIELQMEVMGSVVHIRGAKLVMRPEERVFCHFKLS